MKPLIILLAELSICIAGNVKSEQDLLQELKQKSQSQGLMIVGSVNQFLRVFPFSGRPFARWFLDYTLNVVRFSPDGTALLGSAVDPSKARTPPETIALIGDDGQVVSVLNRAIVNITDVAVSPDRIHVVVAGMDHVTYEVGIFIGKLGTSEIQLVVPLKSESGVPLGTRVGWLPDRRSIVFSRDGGVWTYDL